MSWEDAKNDERSRGSEELRTSEIIPLYRFLKMREEEVENALVGLVDRLERRLFSSLSIEEVEAIPTLSDAAVDELSKKL